MIKCKEKDIIYIQMEKHIMEILDKTRDKV